LCYGCGGLRARDGAGLLLLLLSFRWLHRGGSGGRIRDAGHGDEVYRACGIDAALRVVLCPRLHILVRVRRIRVEHKRWTRHRRLLLLLHLRLNLGLRLWLSLSLSLSLCLCGCIGRWCVRLKLLVGQPLRLGHYVEGGLRLSGLQL
jgi:hypothetical protein